jgi:ABC-type nitrate/sulfonate/bicarbonate transport system substrate-binding protein
LDGSIDATVLVPPENFVAARKGMHVLAQLSDLRVTFPDTVVTVSRSFLKRSPKVIKRYVQAYSEAIFQFKTDSNKATAVYTKRLRQQDQKAIQEAYDYYAPSFSFPPKPDRMLCGRLGFERQRLPHNPFQMEIDKLVKYAVRYTGWTKKELKWFSAETSNAFSVRVDGTRSRIEPREGSHLESDEARGRIKGRCCAP